MAEDPEVGEHYKGKSVAEQRSFDISWELLQEDKFAQLRTAIYSNRAEEAKFRQLVVNSVMSTDIFDKDLKKLRDDRWARAFGTDIIEADEKRAIDRKATIVIEHLIQSSDVAHTMQHWAVYSKWNERLYMEMYQAFLDGRSDKDPTDGWYEGEIWFFDNYIIPLAKRLKECGVYLGVSGDEYLDFATKNRKEWTKKGRKIVKSMQERRPNEPSL
jgi:3'5'-cyclic nucleotide phosphodiesterase